MFSFEYTVTLNEFGRPVITPSKKTDTELDLVEHKFMGLELARTIITSTVETQRSLSDEDYTLLKSTLLGLERISDIFATAVRDQMTVLNDAKVLLTPQKYDLQVGTMDNLHGLNYNGIIYGESVYARKEGLRVMVLETKRVYELKGGIDNEHWYDTTPSI